MKNLPEEVNLVGDNLRERFAVTVQADNNYRTVSWPQFVDYNSRFDSSMCFDQYRVSPTALEHLTKILGEGLPELSKDLIASNDYVTLALVMNAMLGRRSSRLSKVSAVTSPGWLWAVLPTGQPMAFPEDVLSWVPEELPKPWQLVHVRLRGPETRLLFVHTGYGFENADGSVLRVTLGLHNRYSRLSSELFVGVSSVYPDGQAFFFHRGENRITRMEVAVSSQPGWFFNAVTLANRRSNHRFGDVACQCLLDCSDMTTFHLAVERLKSQLVAGKFGVRDLTGKAAERVMELLFARAGFNELGGKELVERANQLTRYDMAVSLLRIADKASDSKNRAKFRLAACRCLAC